MKFSDDRRPEFKINPSVTEKFDALLYRRGVEATLPDRHRILRKTVFYIHGNIIDKPLRDHMPEPFREAAVRIELEAITESFYLRGKPLNIGIQKRLTSRNTHTVKYPATFLK